MFLILQASAPWFLSFPSLQPPYPGGEEAAHPAIGWALLVLGLCCCLCTRPCAVGVTAPLCRGPARVSSLHSGLSVDVEVSAGRGNGGACSGPAALGPKVMSVELKS